MAKIEFGDAEIEIPDFPLKTIIAGAVALLLIVASLSSFYTVDAYENGVVLRFGKYTKTTEPGLHFKLPFGIERVYKVEVAKVLKEEFGFRTLKAGKQSQFSKSRYTAESWMLTGDQNIADVEWIVQYQIKDPVAYLFNVKDPKDTIRDLSEATMRLLVGDHSFHEVLQIERKKIAEESKNHLQKLLDNFEAGISIKMVQLQDVHPPEPVADSFNEVNRAKQEKETMINQAQREFNKQFDRVEGDAQRMVAEAEGYAIERVNQAKGDVALFTKVLKEYNKAPQITKDRLYIETMEDVLGAIPDKVILDESVEGFLPFLNVQGGAK